jgi:hypothetical protein
MAPYMKGGKHFRDPWVDEIKLAVSGDQGGCCDNGNEQSGSIKGNQFISLVRAYPILCGW